MAASGSRGSILGVILLVVLVGAGGRALWLWLDRPVERVSIRGDLEHVSADYLRGKLAPLVSGQTWLSVNLDTLRDRARNIEWLDEVRVSRHWPNALTFELFEQQPVARWNDTALLNPRGEPFQRDGVAVDETLPDLAGPAGSGAEVLGWYDRLQNQLKSLGLQVTQLRLEDRGAWRFQVNDGLWVMLGRNAREERLARFIAAWRRQLGSQASRIRYIDLRYPNGVAVAWHGENDGKLAEK
ncbi:MULTISPECIES: cell division protein FtsQ/DivIB [Modicisalibacter]|uniref:cell division protein FtsQ/DivIB n=1 Tax=Modicisalibacter TaxID=574347 RepID=UPI00100A5D60|nr:MULTISPECIES: cell division protein FtsQ/DivIB [Halomonadaceae]MBZ9557150.1 cell division protein FtsQ/DivIB [Modicisalibacter sp. R2A 31.J]MBZ9574136.1 cell division protein FtsQ/DivIB [Modicisalibacter sp. MOD 31.J]